MSLASPGARPAVARTGRLAPVGAIAGPGRLPAHVAVGLHLLVWGSLFSGLPGPSALGELSGEGTLLGWLAIMLSATGSGAVLDVRGLKSGLMFLPFLACIGLSAALNWHEIAQAHFLGREGGEKFITSLLVAAFYLCAFTALCGLAEVFGVRAIVRCAGNAALVVALVLLTEMAVEIVSWFVPPIRSIWVELRRYWTINPRAPTFRLVGFAPEPAFCALAAMSLLSLLIAELALRREAGQRARSARARIVVLAGILLLALELFLANARTFIIGAAGASLAALLLSRPFARLPASAKSAVIVLLPLPVHAALIWWVSADPATRSVSDTTRSVGMLVGAQMWREHPLVGVGFGQYGFHFRALVPSWAMSDYELSRYFRFDQYDLLGALQPTFSLFTRTAAELGLLGLAAWLAPPLLAIRSAIRRAPGLLTSVMVCALAAQLWSFMSFDSYRNANYWFWLALLLAWPKQRPASWPSPAHARNAAQREISMRPRARTAAPRPVGTQPATR